MKKRLLNDHEAIEWLVNEFYRKVQKDEIIGYIFNEAENFSWDLHIPIMIDFWETMLLGTSGYRGNVMQKHIELHKRTPLNEEHFRQWKKLFYETLDDHFEGDNVTEARRRVEMMAPLMMYKIEQSTKKGFIQ